MGVVPSARRSGWIAPRLWARIHANIPILCVDIAVMDGDSMLLLKRRKEPMKGEWMVPGGRIRKGEYIAMAAERIVLDETGLTIGYPRVIGMKQLMFGRSPFKHSRGTHTVSLIAVATRCGGKMQIDKNHSAYQLAHPRTVINGDDMHEYTKLIASKVSGDWALNEF